MDTVEKHWPHFADLERRIKGLTSPVAHPTAPPTDAERGRQYVKAIIQYELANGKGWRS